MRSVAPAGSLCGSCLSHRIDLQSALKLSKLVAQIAYLGTGTAFSASGGDSGSFPTSLQRRSILIPRGAAAVVDRAGGEAAGGACARDAIGTDAVGMAGAGPGAEALTTRGGQPPPYGTRAAARRRVCACGDGAAFVERHCSERRQNAKSSTWRTKPAQRLQWC